MKTVHYLALVRHGFLFKIYHDSEKVKDWYNREQCRGISVASDVNLRYYLINNRSNERSKVNVVYAFYFVTKSCYIGNILPKKKREEALHALAEFLHIK